MSIRAFRRLSRAERRAYISRVQDPLTLRVLEIAFLGAGKVSWAKVACMIGGGNTPDSVRMMASSSRTSMASGATMRRQSRCRASA